MLCLSDALRKLRYHYTTCKKSCHNLTKYLLATGGWDKLKQSFTRPLGLGRTVLTMYS